MRNITSVYSLSPTSFYLKILEYQNSWDILYNNKYNLIHETDIHALTHYYMMFSTQLTSSENLQGYWLGVHWLGKYFS